MTSPTKEEIRGRLIPAAYGEEWRPVRRFSDYFVSSFGRVYSYRRSRGFLKPSPRRKGYLAVTIFPGGSGANQVNVDIHKLVLEAFVGPRPEGMECCHWDGNPANNRLDNLRWDTQENNFRDSIRHGRRRAKLTPAEAATV